MAESSSNIEWHDVVRAAHLGGGLRAINEPGPTIQFSPRLSQEKSNITINNYKDFHNTLLKEGFDLIGVDYFQGEDHIAGRSPPVWRPSHKVHGDLSNRAQEYWSRLATGGHEIDSYPFVDICERISFQIKACAWRVRELSESYRQELSYQIHAGKFNQGERFQSMNGFYISLAVHSFLIEAATLRDYLAEFLSEHIFQSQKKSTTRIRLMKGLRKNILPNVNSSHPLKVEIEQISSDSGWLTHLSAYRDLAVHYTPLETADNLAPIEKGLIVINSGTTLPKIHFALPPDPVNLRKTLSEGQKYSRASEWLKESFRKATEEGSGPDALLYCHSALNWISEFALRVASYSEVKPRMVHYTMENGAITKMEYVDP